MQNLHPYFTIKNITQLQARFKEQYNSFLCVTDKQFEKLFQSDDSFLESLYILAEASWMRMEISAH